MSTKIIRTTPVFRLHARTSPPSHWRSSLRDIITTRIEGSPLSGLSCCVGIGKPATTYRLIVDTGSSNTWVGANKIYNKTTSSNEIPNIVSVKYGSGFFSGSTFTDEVTIAPGLVIPDQMLGVAKQSEGFQDVDGILGLGPQVLTHKTLQPDSDSMVPTVTDNLYNLGFLPENKIAIFLNPLVTTSADAIGEIAWGVIDTSKFTGSITYVPVTTAGQHWGINTQSVCYGSTPEFIRTGTTIVDTGTAINYFSSDTFERYRLLTGAVYDNDAKLLRITPDQLKNLQTLIFFIGGTSFALTPDAQLVSRSVTGDKIFLAVARIKPLAGYDYILGETFLKRFYSVFDTAYKRVGFATTQYTTATTN